jgi:hypothetical protein
LISIDPVLIKVSGGKSMDLPRGISRNQWLLIVTVFLSVYGVGQIWLVQLSSYKLWAFVGAREFHDYHWAWWRSIWLVVMAPTSFVFLGSVLMLWMRPAGVPSRAIWLGVALETLLLVGTAFFWGPLMARLANPQTGLIQSLYDRLMLTHWIRVALVTAYGLLAFWMLLKSLSATPVPQ